jgi:hypothetical protein
MAPMAPMPMAPMAPMPMAPMPMARAPMQSYPALDAAARPLALSHHGLDVKAIERDTSIVVDSALDGRNRRLKLILTFVFGIVVVFALLGFALVRSYAPQGH